MPFLVSFPNCCWSTAEATDISAYTPKATSLTPTKRSPTLHGQGRHNLLIHVVHVVSHDEVRRVRAGAAHPAGVNVEGSHQGVDARVIDNLEATEDLNLLPPVQALPQCCCHFTQCLPTDRFKNSCRTGLCGSPDKNKVTFQRNT